MIDPIWLEQMANRRWSKIHKLEKAQKVIESLLVDYPQAKHTILNVLDKEKRQADYEFKEYRREYNLAILSERSEYEQVIADMVEDVVDEKHITEKVMNNAKLV